MKTVSVLDHYTNTYHRYVDNAVFLDGRNKTLGLNVAERHLKKGLPVVGVTPDPEEQKKQTAVTAFFRLVLKPS